MSNDQKAISLDFYQWGAVLSADFARYQNFINNFTTLPERYGAVDAKLIAELHDHLDNTKRMVVAWGAACQKEMKGPSEKATDSYSESPLDQQKPSSLTLKNGAEKSPTSKRRGRPPKNEDRRVRLAPRT